MRTAIRFKGCARNTRRSSVAGGSVILASFAGFVMMDSFGTLQATGRNR
jgi:hypothetical protein